MVPPGLLDERDQVFAVPYGPRLSGFEAAQRFRQPGDGLGGTGTRSLQVRQRFHQLSVEQYGPQHGFAVAAFAGARQHVVIVKAEELLGAGQRGLVLGSAWR